MAQSSSPTSINPIPQSSTHCDHVEDTACLHALPSSVVIFWPERLNSIILPHGHGLLSGRVLSGAQHELVIVVLGLAKLQADGKPIAPTAGHALVGSCRAQGQSRHSPLHPGAGQPVSPISLDVVLPACHSRLWQHPRRQAIKLASIDIGCSPDLPRLDPQAQTSVTVVYYRPPNCRMLQYYGLEPLRLGPVSGPRLARLGALLLQDDTLDVFASARDAYYTATPLQRKLVELSMCDPARWTELIRDDPASESFPEGTAFRRAIGIINAGSMVQQHAQMNGNAVRGGELLDFVLAPVMALASWMRLVLNTELKLGSWGGRRVKLVTLFSSARQLDARLLQLLIVPKLATRLRSLRKRNLLSSEDLASPYIGLWNSVWLIANDLILGYASSVVLILHRSAIADTLRFALRHVFVDGALDLLAWLGDWPAGLKLNTKLSLFFRDAYSTFIVAWRDQVLNVVSPHFEAGVVVVAVAGRLLGVTMSLCLLGDAIVLLTLHMTVFHACARRTFRFFVVALSALFDLFRGKKRNALRGGRLDDATYELDQLLLGTILFTLCLFLVPTCYVFYLAFAAMRLAVVAFETGVLDTLLGMLNHLPLFALMLRFKDPGRLPASVRLDPIDEMAGDQQQQPLRGFVRAHHVVLRSNALGFADIFEGYGDHVRGAFDLPRMVARALVGRPLRR